MRLLVTGITGKVGTNFLPAFLASPKFEGWQIRAVCNERTIDHPQVEVVKCSLSDGRAIRDAMAGTTHVLHMASVKESPDLAMEVGVKGMFNLLEAFRHTPGAQQFILMGGDCSVGHMFHKYDAPITELSPRRAYPGCYALTKVIEEVMLEQYREQYALPGCCIRAPWIMEKDDFKYALSFKDQFGGPRWDDLLAQHEVDRYAKADAVPLLLDSTGSPLKRNFIHVSDLVSAILAALGNAEANGHLFNVAMDRPVDYGEVATALQNRQRVSIAEIETPFHSNWMDNTKAKAVLGWQPRVALQQLIESAWSYVRAPNEPRVVRYPG